MYEYIPFIIAGVMFLLSVFMIIKPELATKKQFRDNDEIVKKTRKNGFIVLVCAIVLCIIGITKLKM